MNNWFQSGNFNLALNERVFQGLRNLTDLRLNFNKAYKNILKDFYLKIF